jgi:hypothetical protein
MLGYHKAMPRESIANSKQADLTSKIARRLPIANCLEISTQRGSNSIAVSYIRLYGTAFSLEALKSGFDDDAFIKIDCCLCQKSSGD